MVSVMKSYEIWVEGREMSGCSNVKAIHATTAVASSFKDACIEFFSTKGGLEYGYLDIGRMTVFGCKLFDNETDARVNYG